MASSPLPADKTGIIEYTILYKEVVLHIDRGRMHTPAPTPLCKPSTRKLKLTKTLGAS